MIIKINKIKKLGLFEDYKPISGLKDFKKYNLIYGWNASGKTTLSRLFDSLKDGSHDEYPDLEFEIENDSSKKYQQNQEFNQNVRVFNQDYVENNLRIKDGKAKSITLILGDISQELIDDTDKCALKLSEKKVNLETKSADLENKQKTRGKTFTEIAKTIYIAILGGATRNYRKDNAESDFSLLEDKKFLTDEKLDELTTSVKQSPKPTVKNINTVEVEFDDGNKIDLNTAIDKILKEAKDLNNQTVESIVIERLKNNEDISKWVENGILIHQEHSSENCEFCGQKIPSLRLEELSKHFNDADQQLKSELDKVLGHIDLLIEKIKSEFVLPDHANLYDELVEDYKKSSRVFNGERDVVINNLQEIKKVLSEKKTKTTESLDLKISIDVGNILNYLKYINDLINSHNKKTLDFEKTKADATKRIKEHYLSSVFDEVNKLDEEIKNCNNEILKIKDNDSEDIENMSIKQLEERIASNKAQISSTHKACEDITSGLSNFLGRKELIFEPNKIKTLGKDGKELEIDDGYIIKRNGKKVSHLSEGEKTAIAFVYFTIHLNDSDFGKTKGIVVIDDPISSLDSNSIFQAFSFLKNSVKDVEQIFILTHNFDFLRLIIGWLSHYKNKKQSSFYMINNGETNGDRVAFIDKLDQDLQDFETEYNYLFKKISDFKSDGTIASVYHIPNIARKVLETFLMFRVPNNKSLYEKLESLKSIFDENKLTSIFKFTNDQSHMTGKGFDPSLVPEAQKNVKYLLELIETTFPEHYKILTENT